jgi:hypothetical protein
MRDRLAPGLASVEREGFVGSVLFCADCKAAHRIAPADSAVIFLSDGTPSTIEDYQVFLGVHVHHRLRWLRRGSDLQAPSRPRTEDVFDSHEGDV